MKSKSKARVEVIYRKIQQSGYRCALSGWTITPNSFELDHIISIQDGGTDEIENLQAVHPLVNRAKGTMGNQQFIDMCIAVANANTHPPYTKATLQQSDS